MTAGTTVEPSAASAAIVDNDAAALLAKLLKALPTAIKVASLATP